TSPYTIHPGVFNGDHGYIRTKKPFSVSRSGLRAGVVGHARAITRNQIVPQTIIVDRPHHGLDRVFRKPGLESLNSRFFADVKKHDLVLLTPARSRARLRPSSAAHCWA